jgi:hypothetical protein
MIRVIETFPPLPTRDDKTNFLTEHEDVYFTVGCMKLQLPVGDDKISSYFSLHTMPRQLFFGIHQPMTGALKRFIQARHPSLRFLNPDLKLKDIHSPSHFIRPPSLPSVRLHSHTPNIRRIRQT